MISSRLIFGLPLVCAPPKSIFSIYSVKPRASDDNKSDDAAARVSEDGSSSLKSSVSGFGKNTKRYRAKGKGSSTLRLQPSEKPLLAAQPNEGINRFESIFVYALVALFGVIILDGITLAATDSLKIMMSEEFKPALISHFFYKTQIQGYAIFPVLFMPPACNASGNDIGLHDFHKK